VRPYLEKIHHKKGLAERLDVLALSSSPSTAKKKTEPQTWWITSVITATLGGSQLRASLGKNNEIHISTNKQAWCFTHVMPVIQEESMRRSRSQVG
jgi:hypothetical protein